MSTLTKDNLIRLHPLTIYGDHLDEVLNISSTFGYVFQQKHDKHYPKAPIVTNDDGTRFGYVQIKVAYRAKTTINITLQFIQKEPLVIEAGTYFDYDMNERMLMVKDSLGFKHWVPVHYFMYDGHELLREVKCLYFVFKSNCINMTERYQSYLADKMALKDLGFYTKERDKELKAKWVILPIAPKEMIVL